MTRVLLSLLLGQRQHLTGPTATGHGRKQKHKARHAWSSARPPQVSAQLIIPPGPAWTHGRALGRAVRLLVLRLRGGDGASNRLSISESHQ